MSQVSSPSPSDLLRLSAQIVSAHAVNNAVPPPELPALIRGVYAALAGVDQPSASNPEPMRPAVPVRRSVFADYIICLEDGARMKMLTRYLMRRYKLTPEQYRTRWGLPRDYPMVAPSFTERRSTATKHLGVGRRPDIEPAPPATKRGRKAKV